MMNTSTILAGLMGATLMLSGCSSNKAPTFGDTVLTESSKIGAIGEKWETGQKLIRKGEKQLAKGEKQIKDGEKNINEGEAKIVKGKRLIAESEREYKLRQQAGEGG